MDRGQLQPLLLPDLKETGKELGRGAYGVVTEVIVSGTTCAAKKLHDAIVQDYTLRRFCDEVLLHSHQRHPNIVQLIGVYYPPRSQLPMLVMEYLPLSLTQCLEREELPLQMKYSVLLDVAKGLCYLHGKRPPIVHRDLTANNVLLTSSYSAKISDLGVSRLADTFKMHDLTTAPGNAMVMPPEALEDNPVYDHKLDVFSYGCLILHVLTGQFPEPTNQFVPEPRRKDSFKRVSEWDRRSNFIKNIPKENEFLSLVKQCLNDAPTGRPKMIDVLQFVEQGLSIPKFELFQKYQKQLATVLSSDVIGLRNFIIPDNTKGSSGCTGPVVSKNEMLSFLLSSCPIPSCEEQGKQIRPYLTEYKHLKRGDKWYLVDFRWLNEWKKYTSVENECFGKSIAHPGPVHNAFLFKGENTEELKDYLREGPDYALLPEEAWNYLINWYGLSLHSKPIMRPVVEAPSKYLMVEVYKNTRDKSK